LNPPDSCHLLIMPKENWVNPRNDTHLTTVTHALCPNFWVGSRNDVYEILGAANSNSLISNNSELEFATPNDQLVIFNRRKLFNSKEKLRVRLQPLAD